MANKLATFIVIILVLVLAGTIIYFKSGLATQNNQVSVDAAKWIGNHSVVYVQAGCSHCVDQEAMFGDNWEYINSVDCVASPQNAQTCVIANITATPTWVINGQQYIGVQSIATLEQLTGYTGK
jgi:glutaredoxin